MPGPFSLVWNSTSGGLTSFTSITISSTVSTGCPSIFTCSSTCTPPTGIPETTLTCSTTGSPFGTTSFSMPYQGSGLWQSGCITDGTYWYKFSYQCVSNTMVFKVNRYPTSACTGATTVCSSALSSPQELAAGGTTCSPFSAEFNTTASLCSILGTSTYTLTP